MICKEYPIVFRDDYNGRPKIYIVNDTTKFLRYHPFYSTKSDDYGRYYTYYSLDDQFSITEDVEICISEYGSMCIEDYWDELLVFLTNINVNDVEFSVSLGETSFVLKKVSPKDFIRVGYGYIKLTQNSTANIFVVLKVDVDYSLDVDRDKYVSFGCKKPKDVSKRYKKGYVSHILNNKRATRKYKGNVYGIGGVGIFLVCAEK